MLLLAGQTGVPESPKTRYLSSSYLFDVFVPTHHVSVVPHRGAVRLPGISVLQSVGVPVRGWKSPCLLLPALIVTVTGTGMQAVTPYEGVVN